MSYKHYHITLSNAVDSYTFIYELSAHRPAQEWARQMDRLTVDSLRVGLDPWLGIHNLPEAKINRLNQLIDLLNEWIPDKILDKWDSKNPQSSLNKLHIHFPEQEKTETDPARVNQLSEYNDVIHALEYLIRKISYKDSLCILVIPESDFKTELNTDDYQHFKASREFGELCLHYPHVGRHALELLNARDIVCPVDQIVTQKLITPYHSLRFSKDPYSEKQYHSAFDKFYKISKINQLVDRNDPKIAVGYIPIGKLVSVNDSLVTIEVVTDIVKNTNKILGWKIT
jgi:hypothetical protein